MVELTRHIEILLLDNDCVIVPGLGGFMAHYVCAEYSEEDEVFYQPSRSIGFNPQLRLNDSLLAQSYVEAYDVSYPEALCMIASEVEEVRQMLAVNGSFDFHGIGTLKLTSEEKYDFVPCTAGLLTPSLYALCSYSMKAVAKKPVVLTVQTDDNIDDEEKEVTKARRIDINALRYVLAAAMLLLFFVFSSIPVGLGSNDVQQCSVIDTNIVSAFLKNNKTMESFTVATTDTAIVNVEDDAATQQEVKEEEVSEGYFTIVLASKVGKKGAEDYVNNLKAAGYKDATVYEHGTMRRVVMGKFSTESDAANTLNKLRNADSQFAEAWIDYNS
ncbi:MAG: SPOR domain-containing protein [Prevotella sp.]|nr:SPOR domain-containing protein [Prevotella sp.]